MYGGPIKLNSKFYTESAQIGINHFKYPKNYSCDHKVTWLLKEGVLKAYA